MSDTVLALIVTGMVLLTLAAWVPLLHAAEKLTLRYSRQVARETLDTQKIEATSTRATEVA